MTQVFRMQLKFANDKMTERTREKRVARKSKNGCYKLCFGYWLISFLFRFFSIRSLNSFQSK